MTDDNLSTWDAYVGPFHDTASVLRLLRIDADGLEALVRRREVLRLVTKDGADVYPAFQFGSDGSPLPHISKALNYLTPAPECRWGDALWLNAPDADLDGLTPAQTLRTDRFEEALRLACQAGAFRLP
ncbi:hypothetical protein EDF46_3353 [Frondihabitans sp. PhB188]|uniref:hypothetical protein n=1 Tax=Frondihabitans sp. PhB188 TaxID=2485200 RepID=UPI000F470C9A|nr:hypothetical protein [Frondihabitans sp. PhB188]ROQ36804.1 hypothetical protein EDF46_3353 [Frondihabitans sp. PhB188]